MSASESLTWYPTYMGGRKLASSTDVHHLVHPTPGRSISVTTMVLLCVVLALQSSVYDYWRTSWTFVMNRNKSWTIAGSRLQPQAPLGTPLATWWFRARIRWAEATSTIADRLLQSGCLKQAEARCRRVFMDRRTEHQEIQMFIVDRTRVRFMSRCSTVWMESLPSTL